MTIALPTVYHQFQAKITHHEYEEMEIDIDWNRSDECSQISIKVDDGSKSRVTVTLAELREIIALGERFEAAHIAIIKGEKP